MQVATELGAICQAQNMKVQAIYGGVSFGMQASAIRQDTHSRGYTGRALDMISRGAVDLSGVKHVVLDEGDTMLEMGFQKDVENIILNVKKPGEKARAAAAKSLQDDSYDDEYADEYDDGEEEDGYLSEDEDEEKDDGQVDQFTSQGQHGRSSDVQMLLFSATMPGWICKVTDKHMDHPVFLDAVQEGETRLADTITHLAVRLPPARDRFEAISSVAEDLILTKCMGGQSIVFTNTKEEADRLVSSDCLGSLRAQVLHGDISQNTRQTTLKALKQGSIDVLVATDVAARDWILLVSTLSCTQAPQGTMTHMYIAVVVLGVLDERVHRFCYSVAVRSANLVCMRNHFNSSSYELGLLLLLKLPRPELFTPERSWGRWK